MILNEWKIHEGGKDEFEVKMEADKEKGPVGGGLFLFCFVFWKISTH